MYVKCRHNAVHSFAKVVHFYVEHEYEHYKTSKSERDVNVPMLYLPGDHP